MRELEVKERAKELFSAHKVHQLLNIEDYQHWYCSDGGGFNWFNVVVVPDYLFITGDLGDYTLWLPKTNVLKYVRSHIDNTHYLGQKCVAGKVMDDFVVDRAQEWLAGERAELAAGRIDAMEVESEVELKEIDRKMEVLDEAELLLYDGYRFQELLLREYVYDGEEIYDVFEDYAYSFLYCREALRFLINQLETK